MMAFNFREYASRGAGTAFIIAFRAVGNRKLCVTRWRCMSSNAFSGSKRARPATMGRPKYRVGSKASIRPPVHAQSAGLQNTASSGTNQFWLHTKPLRLPISARWGISAPLGGPVVPLV